MSYREPPGWRNLRMGMFFLITLGILVAALLVVGTNARLFERKYQLMVYLTNAHQLDRGSMVSLAGLEVGRVKNVRLVHREDGRLIELTLALPRSRQAQITESSVANIRTVGVLGDRFIDISPGQPGEAPLPEGSMLRVKDPVDWPSTFERASGAIDDLLGVVSGAREVLRKANEGDGVIAALLNDGDMASDLRGSSDNLQSVTRSLRDGKGSLGRMIKDPAMADRFDSLLTRVDSVVERLEKGDGTLARLLRDEEMADQLGRAIAGSDSLMADIRTGDGTAGRLIRDDEMYQELMESARQLKLLLADIQAHPDRYLDLSLF